MEMSKVVPIAAAGLVAAGAVAYALESGGSAHSGDPKVVPAAEVTQLASTDCAETPLGLDQYATTVGSNMMQPISAQLINGQWEFNQSSDAETISDEVAQQIGSNTAALAIVYTIIDAAKTNVIPADVVTEAASTLDLIQTNTADRNQICNIVVSGILGAPEEFNYQSATGSILTFSPVYDANKDLSGLDGNVSNNTGPTDVFNIAPVAGSENYALQKAIAANWGITPEGQIIETAHQNGNSHPANTGKPTKTAPKGNVQSQAPKSNSNTSGSSSNTIVHISGGSTGGGGGAGPHPQSLPGRSPHGPGPTGAPEGRPHAKHNTPSGGGSSGGEVTTTTPTTTTPVETTPTTTPTGTTPTETTPTTTTPTETTPTTTTPTTTTPTTTTPIQKPGDPGQPGA
jgi:uncharacterized membrane protein YgcG